MTYGIGERRPPRPSEAGQWMNCGGEIEPLPSATVEYIQPRPALWYDFMREMERTIAATMAMSYEAMATQHQAVQRTQAAEIDAWAHRLVRKTFALNGLTQALQVLYKKPCKLHRQHKLMPERHPVGTWFHFVLFDYGGEYLSMALFKTRKESDFYVNTPRPGGRVVLQRGRIKWKRHALNLLEQPPKVILP